MLIYPPHFYSCIRGLCSNEGTCFQNDYYLLSGNLVPQVESHRPNTGLGCSWRNRSACQLGRYVSTEIRNAWRDTWLRNSRHFIQENNSISYVLWYHSFKTQGQYTYSLYNTTKTLVLHTKCSNLLPLILLMMWLFVYVKINKHLYKKVTKNFFQKLWSNLSEVNV